MSIPFLFPLTRQKIQVLDSLRSIKQQIEKLASISSIYNKIFKYQLRSQGKYVYVKCRYCTANLRYSWLIRQNSFKMTHFNNQHHHIFKQDIAQQLNKLILDLPFGIDLPTARKIAVQKLGITPSQFYHTFNRIKKNKSSLKQLIKELQLRDYFISIDPFPFEEEQLPRIIIIISPEMKRLFKLYGQVCCYDLTYNLVQEISNKNRQYAVGIFTGVNCYNRIIPFGISITCEQTTEVFCKIFETFIQINGSPQSFITDEQTAMGSAINRLRQIQLFNGTHLYDSFHVIRNFGKMSNRKDLMNLLSQIIRQQTPTKFQLKIEQFQKKLKTQNQLRAFQLFQRKIPNVCFSMLEKGSFVIFNSSNSINQKINDMIKSRVRSIKPYNVLLKMLIQFCETVVEQSQKSVELYDFRIQEIFNDTSLKLCRYMLAKRPMEEFIKQYVGSLHLKEPKQTGRITRFTQNQMTIIVQIISQNQMNCNCLYFEKTGIVCRHMLYICRTKKINYLDYLHERWKFTNNQKVIKHQKTRNRLTRKRKL